MSRTDAPIIAPALHDAIRDRIQGLYGGSHIWIDVDPAVDHEPNTIRVEAFASGRSARYVIRIEPEEV